MSPIVIKRPDDGDDGIQGEWPRPGPELPDVPVILDVLVEGLRIHRRGTTSLVWQSPVPGAALFLTSEWDWVHCFVSGVGDPDGPTVLRLAVARWAGDRWITLEDLDSAFAGFWEKITRAIRRLT